MADIKASLERVFAEMTEIKVITAIGSLPVKVGQAAGNGGGTSRTKTTITGDSVDLSDAIVTIFDITDGDVTNVIAPSLVDNEALRTFHAAQVEKSLAVLPDNIRAMVDLGKSLINELR